MLQTSDKNLRTLEAELRFITRHVNNLDTRDFDEVDEINMALDSAKRALFEYVLSLQPTAELAPSDVPEQDDAPDRPEQIPVDTPDADAPSELPQAA